MRLAVGTALAALALAALALVAGGPGVALAVDPPTPARGDLALHESTAPTPTPDDPHSGHDMSDQDMGDMDMGDMSEEEMADLDGTDGHQGHGSGDSGDPVSGGTRTAVLGGFAVVNAGVLGGALLLRRHDRRHPRHGSRAGRAAR